MLPVFVHLRVENHRLSIPKLKKQDVIDALKFIDENGVPEHNTSVKYVLVSEDGKKYPPKYVLAVADHLANSTDISTESFNSVDAKNYLESLGFSIETKDLKAEVKGLQQQIHEQEQQAENIEQFVQRVKRNSTLTELTPYALRELVKAVYVDAPDKSSGKRRQKVHIEYDLVGYIPVDELLKAEQA